MPDTLIVQTVTPIPVNASSTQEKKVTVTASDPLGGEDCLYYADHPGFDAGGEGIDSLKQGESVTISSRHWFIQPSGVDSCAVLVEEV
jgi:hypothetical protein